MASHSIIFKNHEYIHIGQYLGWSCCTNAAVSHIGPCICQSLLIRLRIISIFGQDLTNNFLRESLSSLDFVIFAVGPLGIIWVLTAILKTVGPTRLKKYILNTNDVASVEQDLMSSTSSEVCELWNGREVVRMIGRPVIKEFFVLDGELCTSQDVKTARQYFRPKGNTGSFYQSSPLTGLSCT